MANVTVPNFGLVNTNDTRIAIWKLSRAMKAAGWVTLSSSNGTTKDTTGAYGSDQWNGTIGTGGSGTGANITSVTGGVATLTNLTGFSTTTAGQRWLNITAASNGANVGTFKILSFISATSVTIRNPAAVTETGTISWTERVPLSDTYTIGASSWINMQGPSVLRVPISTMAQDGYQVNIIGNNQTGTAARITAINGNLVTVTDLTNITFGSSGNILVVSGAAQSANNGSFTIVKTLDPNTVLISNPSAVINDANNGSIHWQERIGLTGIRGENVTQTTTGAQGAVVGINFDFLTGTGYLVIFPRNNGSGGGPFGWNGTSTITGATSGAVWTPTATPTEFIREIVMWAPTTVGPTNINTLTGYMQCINASTENSARFSVLATSAGATATIAPGGGGTNNGFPTPGSYVWIGTGGSQTPARFGMDSAHGTMTNAQIMCADATFDIGRSADGSFTCAIGVPTNAGAYLGFCFTRLDDQENGDVDPYVFYNPSNAALYTPTRTAVTGTYTTETGQSFNAASTTGAAGSSSRCNLATFRGWRGRDTANDGFQNYQIGLLANGSGLYSASSGTGASCALQNISVATDADVVATATVSTTVNTNSVYVGEPIWVVSAQSQFRSMKGTCRWLRCVQLGTGTDTLGGGAGVGFWFQLCTGSTTFPPFVSGPWDGSTTPVK